jgi:hypothetical protein
MAPYLLLLALAVASSTSAWSQPRTVGVLLHDTSRSYKGYTLFAPITTMNTYLIDNDGQVVNTWQSRYPAGQGAMLLDDGSLLRTAAPPSQIMQGGGAGGMVELYDWSGTLQWSYTHITPTARAHHDVEVLPNGNILLLVWEQHTRDEAIALGRSASRLSENSLWSERVVEVRRTGPTTGEVVWSWSSWDHLIQDVDPAKPNYGVVADRPERIDINAGGTRADWLHANSVRYNAKRDEVMISIHNLHEIWIISRATGDIVYRYGNPRNYKRGTLQDQVLWGQHDARWLDDDGRRIMIFNNGMGRPGGNASSVDEIEVSFNEDGTYRRHPDSAFAPSRPFVVYPKFLSSLFFAQNISGATRLPNGNTLSCLGNPGTFVESTPDGEEVWRYVNPAGMNGIASQGQTPRNNMVFKIYRYGLDHPAFEGKVLTPRGRLEEGPLSVEVEGGDPSIRCDMDPSNGRVVIHLAEDARIVAHAYDLLGRFLGVVADELLPSGTYVHDVPRGTMIVRIVRTRH